MATKSLEPLPELIETENVGGIVKLTLEPVIVSPTTTLTAVPKVQSAPIVADEPFFMLKVLFGPKKSGGIAPVPFVFLPHELNKSKSPTPFQ